MTGKVNELLKIEEYVLSPKIKRQAHASSLMSINGQKAEDERHGHRHCSRPHSLKNG